MEDDEEEVTEAEEAGEGEGEKDGARSGGRKAMKDCPVLLSRPPLLPSSLILSCSGSVYQGSSFLDNSYPTNRAALAGNALTTAT